MSTTVSVADATLPLLLIYRQLYRQYRSECRYSGHQAELSDCVNSAISIDFASASGRLGAFADIVDVYYQRRESAGGALPAIAVTAAVPNLAPL